MGIDMNKIVNYNDKINYEDTKKHEINLLGYQIKLILKSLEFYLYTYRYVFPRKEPLTDEEELRISFIENTYFSISEQEKDVDILKIYNYKEKNKKIL